MTGMEDGASGTTLVFEAGEKQDSDQVTTVFIAAGVCDMYVVSIRLNYCGL